MRLDPIYLPIGLNIVKGVKGWPEFHCKCVVFDEPGVTLHESFGHRFLIHRDGIDVLLCPNNPDPPILF